MEKFDKSKGTKIPKKPSETKKGNLLTPTTSSMNHHPLSRRYVGEGGRIPIVSSRRESLTGTMIYVIVTLSISLFLSPLLFVEHRNYEVVGGDVFMGSRKRPTTRNAKQRAGVPVPEGEKFSVAKMVTIFFFFLFLQRQQSVVCSICSEHPKCYLRFSPNRKQNGVSKHDGGNLEIVVLTHLLVASFLAILFGVYY